MESKTVCDISDESRDDVVDRLSMLPDDLLVKILTLVGIQEATRTHGL